MPASVTTGLNHFLLTLVPVLVILVVIGWQVFNFRDISFRDDEIRTVHAATIMSPVEVVRWMSVDIHPPLWRVFATTWVQLFGVTEPVVRFSSVLTLMLALAAFYRVMRDWFDGRTAIIALVLLGMHGLVLYYGHELRPYAALLLWTSLLHLAFLRWLRRPGLRYALLLVMTGAAALYTHFFALYVILGQTVALLVLVCPLRNIYAKYIGLALLTGLAFTGWLPSFLHSFLVTKPGGVDYGIESGIGSLTSVYSILQVQPSPLANLLQGLAILIPLPFLVRTRRDEAAQFRFGAFWRQWYWLIIAGTVLAAAFVTNRWVDVLTQRNLVVVVPALAALTAIGLRALPWQAQLVALMLLLGPSFTRFPAYERVLPFTEVANIIVPQYSAATPVIISVDDGPGDYFALAYTLMDRLPGRIDQTDMLYLTEGTPRVNLPEPMRDPVTAATPATLERLTLLVESTDQVWWVTSGYEPDYTVEFRTQLERDFERVDQIDILGGTRFPTDYRVDLYRRR
jgi:uncharacterized membrane protein